MNTGPEFPSADYDKWRTAGPPDEGCARCGCDGEGQECDIAAYKCACHWAEEDRAAMAADAEYDIQKEAGQ